MFRIKTKRRNVSKRVKIPHCRLGIVSYARLSRTFSSLVCLFVTQESRALFLLLFVCLFVCGVQISHDVSSLAFLLYTRISRIVRLWFVCYARISRTISSLVCLFVCLLRKNLAQFHLLFVRLLRKNLVHCLLSYLFVCYPRISCTVSSLVCFFVTQNSRALFFSCLFVCYARISRTVSSLVYLFVVHKSYTMFRLWFA